MIHEESSEIFDIGRWIVIGGQGRELRLTECGGYTMLGGYGELSTQKLQTIVSLANYKYDRIKIEAAFHFIDAWSGQTAFLRLPQSGAYLWTDSFDFTQTKNSLNLCGSEVGEGKFVSLIESVISPKIGVDTTDNTLAIEFGTTLETDPLYSSYGISALRIYIK